MNTIVEHPASIRTVSIKLVSSQWELAGTQDLRRAVFCEEQGIFQGDDRDAVDARALAIAALMASADGPQEVIGTVRIHQEAPGVWHGSRLAVARHARRIGSVGSGLIQLAVSTAHARGCHTFLAQVQSQNVPLFRKLHWHGIAETEVHGRPHTLMQADLAFYPPNSDGEILLATGRERA
jgi:putative N-acetyltransferase (TIGR04045 family)